MHSIPHPSPLDPRESMALWQSFVLRAQDLFDAAITPAQRDVALYWIDYGQRNLYRWQAAADRRPR